MRQFDEDERRPLVLQSTRSSKNEDARRDFDDFDVDEELGRLRRAVKEAREASPQERPDLYKFIVEAFENLDEHLLREGGLPQTWRASLTEDPPEDPDRPTFHRRTPRPRRTNR